MKKSIFISLILCGVLNATCTNNDNETVSCTQSNLMWQDNKEVKTKLVKWQDALTYCETLNHAGYDDWRMPNIIELKSIVDRSRYGPTLKTGLFAQRGTGTYWSSTTDLKNEKKARVIEFNNGEDSSFTKAYKSNIRCVRDLQ